MECGLRLVMDITNAEGDYCPALKPMEVRGALVLNTQPDACIQDASALEAVELQYLVLASVLETSAHAMAS
jgi:hypothetical protein